MIATGVRPPSDPVLGLSTAEADRTRIVQRGIDVLIGAWQRVASRWSRTYADAGAPGA